MAGGLYIALVTPFSWSVPSAVNQHVADLARELRARGHRPVVVVSSDDARDEHRIPTLFHRARGQVVALLSDYRSGGAPEALLLPSPGVGPLEAEAGIPVVSLGSGLHVRWNGGVANLGLPLDVMSRLEKLMVGAEFDLVHVHEPLAPSLSFTALREARSPVIGTFHLTPVAAAAYELGQPILERFFSRLDARVVTFPTGREIMDELYPGDYEVVVCGAGNMAPAIAGTAASPTAAEGPLIPAGSVGPGPAAQASAAPFALYVYRGDGRRSYRALLRALAADFPPKVERVMVALDRSSASRWVPRGIPRRLAARLTLLEFDSPAELAPLYRAATVLILPFLGGEWLCTTAAEAAACGCPLVGPDLPPVRDLLGLGESTEDIPKAAGAVFSPTGSGSLREAVSLAIAQDRRREPGFDPVGADVRPFTMAAAVDRLEEIYRDTLSITSGRHGLAVRPPGTGRSLHVRGIGGESPRQRLRRVAASPIRPDWINADLHVHSNFSKDCVSSIESILATAREIGLGALAIADHNEIRGAFLARELSQGDPFVIVAEEIKTAEGEVIGLFLREAIPPALSFDQTLSLIKEQGGLVHVPHPFDALRTTPSYRLLVENLHRIDVIEIYNAKVALSSFNLSAERFAAKYNIVAGAGSDAHVLQALGTALIRMPRFDDPQSFMAALWEADIIARRKNLLYLQSLKLLQTTLDRVLPED